MSSGKARSPMLSIIAVIGSLALILILGALGLRSCRQIGLPASEGLPTAVPAPAQVVPTQAPTLVPTVAPPQPPQPTAPAPQPTAPPAQPPTNVQPGGAVVIPSNVEPIPVDSGSASAASSAATSSQSNSGTGSVEPFPADSSSGSNSRNTSGSSRRSTSSGSGMRCGVQVIHVVRSGENLFRIALRYNTTTTAIARLNGIPNVRQIRTGQRLRIVTCR